MKDLHTSMPKQAKDLSRQSGAGQAGMGNNADGSTMTNAAIAALRAAVEARLKAGRIRLPLLPQVANQVLMLSADPKADASQLSSLIHKDPALAGHVLRIANSPGYMPKMPIVSLQQAVARLGMGAVTEIALVASVQSGTFKVPGYENELRQLWRHAVASGAFAKEIARVKRVNVESAFLCGLLHAVGKPALLQVVADAEKDCEARTGIPGDLRAAVPIVLHDLHVPIGVQVSEIWALPKQVAHAVGHYLDYGAAPAFKTEAMICFLSDRFATDFVSPDTFAEGELAQHAVVAELNLYPADMDDLMNKRAVVAKVVESMTT